MRKLIIAVVAMLLGGASLDTLANCAPNTKTVFSCLTGQGKRILVCDAGKTIDYSFGYLGQPGAKPEIVVRTPRAEASTYQWRGIGRALSYSVQVPNGNTLYRVYWSLDRLTENHPVDAGVEVEISQKHVATVKCVGEKHIVQNIDGIDLKPTP